MDLISVASSIRRLEIVIHKTDKPDIVVNILYTDHLCSKECVEMIFWCPKQMRPQLVATGLPGWCDG